MALKTKRSYISTRVAILWRPDKWLNFFVSTIQYWRSLFSLRFIDSKVIEAKSYCNHIINYITKLGNYDEVLVQYVLAIQFTDSGPNCFQMIRYTHLLSEAETLEEKDDLKEAAKYI